jgi:high-affinity nickel permease
LKHALLTADDVLL